MRILFFAIAFLSYSTSFAQKERMNNFLPAEKTQKFIKRWSKELTLSADQQANAQPIILDMFNKMSQLRSDSLMEKNAKNMAWKNARNAGIEGFKALLTPEQVAVYDKKTQEMKEKQKSKKGKEKGEKKKTKNAAEEELENENIF